MALPISYFLDETRIVFGETQNSIYHAKCRIFRNAVQFDFNFQCEVQWNLSVIVCFETRNVQEAAAVAAEEAAAAAVDDEAPPTLAVEEAAAAAGGEEEEQEQIVVTRDEEEEEGMEKYFEIFVKQNLLQK